MPTHFPVLERKVRLSAQGSSALGSAVLSCPRYGLCGVFERACQPRSLFCHATLECQHRHRPGCLVCGYVGGHRVRHVVLTTNLSHQCSARAACNVVLRQKLTHEQLMHYLANQPLCTIAIEVVALTDLSAWVCFEASLIGGWQSREASHRRVIARAARKALEAPTCENCWVIARFPNASRIRSAMRGRLRSSPTRRSSQSPSCL